MKDLKASLTGTSYSSVLMNHQELYQDIMGLDRNIRIVTICDNNGKIMYSDHRPGVSSLLSPDESRKSLEMAVYAWKSRSQLASKIGKGKYVLAEYEKIKPSYGSKHFFYDLNCPFFSYGFEGCLNWT